MSSYSVYLTYLVGVPKKTTGRLASISYKNIEANSSSEAIEMAMIRAKEKVKNNITPIEVSMFWKNYP